MVARVCAGVGNGTKTVLCIFFVRKKKRSPVRVDARTHGEGATSIIMPAEYSQPAARPCLTVSSRLHVHSGILVADSGGGVPMEHFPPGQRPPRFIPSFEWQRVLPGQQVPPGLWIKMDVSSGVTYAKFMGTYHTYPFLPHPRCTRPCSLVFHEVMRSE